MGIGSILGMAGLRHVSDHRNGISKQLDVRRKRAKAAGRWEGYEIRG